MSLIIDLPQYIMEPIFGVLLICQVGASQPDNCYFHISESAFRSREQCAMWVENGIDRYRKRMKNISAFYWDCKSKKESFNGLRYILKELSEQKNHSNRS